MCIVNEGLEAALDHENEVVAKVGAVGRTGFRALPIGVDSGALDFRTDGYGGT